MKGSEVGRRKTGRFDVVPFSFAYVSFRLSEVPADGTADSLVEIQFCRHFLGSAETILCVFYPIEISVGVDIKTIAFHLNQSESPLPYAFRIIKPLMRREKTLVNTDKIPSLIRNSYHSVSFAEVIGIIVPLIRCE